MHQQRQKLENWGFWVDRLYKDKAVVIEINPLYLRSLKYVILVIHCLK